MATPTALTELRARLHEVQDLAKAAALLGWDQDVMMPRGGAAVRAEQLGTLGRLAHERFTDPQVGRWLDALKAHEAALPYDSDDASLIRVARRDYEKAVCVPSSLRAEMTTLASHAREAWVEARATSQFSQFEPFLAQTLALKRRYLECLPRTAEPYDALLDEFEPGMTSAEVRVLFDRLKAGIVPLLARIAPKAAEVSDRCLHGDFPEEQQRALSLAIVRRLGMTDTHWRLDPTVHPFATNTSINDIRITTRYQRDLLTPALFGTIHEFGHGLYEHGISLSLERTLLADGASLGLHESQSRLWENLVGRSRAAWSAWFPILRSTFPAQFNGVLPEEFYRAINVVRPSFIRVEADELTYVLHVILRFELEQEMLDGRLALCDLPAAWNTRMRDYLGIDVPDDAQGCLQDVHWSAGYIGYFPTYAIGSVISAQLWNHAMSSDAALADACGRGEYEGLAAWLRQAVHRHGRKFTPRETLERAIGDGRVDPEPYLAYLTKKYSDIYGLTDATHGHD